MGDFALSFLAVETKKLVYSNMALVGQKNEAHSLRRATELSGCRNGTEDLKQE